jgi:hypothetical protein
MDYTYFAARSDAVAAAALDWPRGPQHPPTEKAAAGLLSEVVDGVQFSQELGRFAQLLTGTDGDLEGGEHVVAEIRDGRGIMLRVPPALVRTIAETDAERLHGLVPEWAEFKDFAASDPDRLRAFTDDLRRLCTAAVQAGGGVYSYGWA